MTETDFLHLRVIHINDVYELDNFASFKTLVDVKKGKKQDRNNITAAPDKTLVVLAGDFLAPSLLSSLDKGRAMTDIMNMCGITHVCFGNHETDVPMDALAKRIRESQFIWVNSNMREIDDKIGVETKPFEIVEVQHQLGGYPNKIFRKKVGILGLLTEDPTLYRPGAFADSTIQPVSESTQKYLETVLPPEEIDLILPLTHQRMPSDREFANTFTGKVFPVIIGGHDHEPYDEVVSGTRIIKTGHDAIHTAVIDFKWKIHENGEISTKPPLVEVELIPTSTYDKDPKVEKKVQCHRHVLEELEKSKLFRFVDWLDEKNNSPAIPFSTQENRLEPSNGSRVLTSMLRRGMRAQCCILNAGSIRGNTVYSSEQEWFSWSDLKKEIPFPTELVAIYIPGKILEATIAHSRRLCHKNPPVASGGYIQVCDRIVFNDDTGKIETIEGKAFQAEELYLTAMPENFFVGVDNHEPLLEWAKTKPKLATNIEAGRPAKMLIVELFSALLWLEMGSFTEIDTDGDGFITRDEVKKRASKIFGEEVADLVIESAMSIADLDQSGRISPIEMMAVQYVATDMLNHVPTEDEIQVMCKIVSEALSQKSGCTRAEVRKLVRDIMKVLDLTGNGRITREEAMKALGKLKQRKLLA